MNDDERWSVFHRIVESPWEHAREWKESTGGAVIGHLLPDVPEEILHATGAAPLAVEGAGFTASHAQAHIPSFTCGHAMGALELAIRGDLGTLDAMVIPYVCDTTRNLHHIWTRLVPDMPTELLRLPKRLDFPGVRDYLAAEFDRLGRALGAVTGKIPSTADLAESTALYNQSRARLREAYAKHRTCPEVWTAERLTALTSSAMRVPRDRHLTWMEALPWDAEPSTEAMERIPVYVRGKLWDPPGLLQVFDRLGLTIVQDEVVTGYRSIAEDAPLNGDPIAALADRHLKTAPYPGYHDDPRRLAAGFLERVKASGALGVVFLNPKFCEAAAFDTPDFQQALTDNSISSLILENAARDVSVGRIEVRLEAFREMLSDDTP